jgi:hypothetical protein
MWACGAAGSALPWHGRGHRFDPDQVHQTTPTKSSVCRKQSTPSSHRFGVIWCQIRRRLTPTVADASSWSRLLRCPPVPRIRLSQLRVDGIDSRLNAGRNLLHIDISGRSGARVPHDTLHVFDRPFLLCKSGDRPANHLEGQPRVLRGPAAEQEL